MRKGEAQDTNGDSYYSCRLTKIILKYSAVALITALIISFFVQFGFRPVQIVSIDNEPVAVVPSKKHFNDIMERMQQHWSKQYKKDIKVSKKPSLKLAILPEKFISKPKFVINAIQNNTNILVKAFGIIVNGESKVVLKDKSSCEEVLKKIKNQYVEKEVHKIEFCEDVKVSTKYVTPDKIKKTSQAVEILTGSNNSVKEYTVKPEDTLWDIAEANNISVDKLCKLNPKDLDTLHPGQKIKITIPRNVINIKTTKFIEVKKNIPYETEYRKDPERYKGQRQTINKGKSGQKQVKIALTKKNGVKIKRQIVEENVISSPQTEVIAVGSKTFSDEPSVFSTPVFGSITSRFGFRDGRSHEGIDIASDWGDPVYAAASGKVIFSGYKQGYGKIVIIKHGSKYKTCYGHNSVNLVSPGQYVDKGEKIAKVGSTGHSTGPHVHFEVRKYDKPINPMKFLK